MIQKHKHFSRIFELVAKIIRNDGLNGKTNLTVKEFRSIQENNSLRSIGCCEFGGIQNTATGFQFDISVLVSRKPFSSEVELTLTCPHCDAVVHTKEGIQLDFLGGK